MTHFMIKKEVIASMNAFLQKAFIAFLLSLTLLFPQKALAIPSEPLICNSGATCEVGEFVYDDSYTPVSNASCKLKSWYPDGSIFVNSQTMPHEAEGWYAYDFVATGSAGLYRSQVCCTVSGETMCLDKSVKVQTATSTLTSGDVAGAVWNANKASYNTAGSFGSALQNAVPTTSDIATSVWGYSGRTLSNFGSLVSDIWSYSARSLTTFGTLIADIWGNSTRTLTGNQLSGGAKLATEDDVQVSTRSAVAVIKGSGNKDLTDVATDIAGVKSDTGSIKTTVEATKTVVDNIYLDTQSIRTTVNSILAKWGSLSASDINTNVTTVSNKLGTSSDTSAQATVFGRIKELSEASGSDMLEDIYDQAAAAASTISLVRTELDYNGRTYTAYQDLQRVIGYIDSLEDSIGTSSDAATVNTLFGRFKKVQDKVDTLGVIESDLETILDKWGDDTNIEDVYAKVSEISDKLAGVNTVTNITSILNETNTTNVSITNLKNEVITLQALAQVNREMLEKVVNKPVITTFLLEGSVIFKSLITNPSTLVSQTVPFVYYLPSEVKKEHILEMDEELTLSFDNDKKQYYVTAEITVGPGDSKTVSVRVEDIWQITDEELASLRKQADELYKPLAKTSYFGQAVTIKSDIDVALDKIAQRQKSVTTPASKLQAYEDAKIELQGVKTKIEKLKELVGLASSAGSLLGFVGGAQAIAVWGLIIIISAGFVFLAIYMRMLKMQEVSVQQATAVVPEVTKPIKGKKGKKKALEVEITMPTVHEKPHLRVGKFVRLALIICAISSSVSFIAGLGVYKMVSMASKTEAPKEIAKTESQSETVIAKQTENENGETEEVLGASETPASAKTIQIAVSKETPVYLRSKPSNGSVILVEIKESQEAVQLDEEQEFVKVRLSQDAIAKEGWVSKEFIPELLSSESSEKEESEIAVEKKEEVLPTKLKQYATILDTPTGFLRVRKTPGGLEVGKVFPGDTLPVLGEKTGWVEVEMEDKSTGWISKQYTLLDKKITSMVMPHSN